MAEEIGLSGQSATADVTVNIVDDNDNVPKFNQDHYDVTIPENVLPGTVVVQVSHPFAFRDFCLLGSLVTSVLLLIDSKHSRLCFGFSGGPVVGRDGS